jgi:hypothetical protein
MTFFIHIEIKINLHHLNMHVVSCRVGLNMPTNGPGRAKLNESCRALAVGAAWAITFARTREWASRATTARSAFAIICASDRARHVLSWLKMLDGLNSSRPKAPCTRSLL